MYRVISFFLCGYTSEEVKSMGLGYFTSHVPDDELKMLFKINLAAFRFFYRLPVQERNGYSISYDFHMINKGEKFLMRHSVAPLSMDNNGRIWLAICRVSVSNNANAGNIHIRKLGQPNFWEYDLHVGIWHLVDDVRLTNLEKEVILLSAQGMTIDEISRKINRASDSVKSRKRAIYAKLDVRSIAEALTMAQNYKLL